MTITVKGETQDMNEIQKAMVDSRISDLLREADALRAERRQRSGTVAAEVDDVGAVPPAGGHRPARVRLGQWLIGVGAAVAGSSGEPQGGATGRAA